MHFSTSLAILGLAAVGRSHMIMNTPVPFGKSSLNNSPLAPDGSDFPCKQRTGVYEAEGASNSMALGSEQPLSFTGSAVHGGGSCQISITYDKQPSKSSTWKVIHSIEGGCPMRDISGNNGNDASQISPSQYTFKIPDNLPAGEAVLAWSWMNKIGNREMYMNCAPVTFTGGSAKRSDDEFLSARNVTELYERDVASYNSLPDMFVANINQDGGACHTADSKNVKYPNPGSSVEHNGEDTDLAPPTGNCGTAAGTPADGGSSSAAPVVSAPATSASAPVATSSKATIPGGVFITVPAPSAADPTPSASASAAPVESEVSTSVVIVVPTPAPIQSASPPTGTGTTGSGQALSGACTTEGEWNCISGSSFQQCGSGTWSVVQQLAAGTECTPGQSATFAIKAISQKEKRAIRFSHEHFRRHHHRSS